MRNKPVKWGFKLWVISDPTGYTLDFNVYTGKSENHGQHGLAYNVVQELIAPYIFQRYLLFFDNFYSSTKLLGDLYKQEVYATGTFRIDRRGIPDDVKAIKVAPSGSKITRGTGYYIRFTADPEPQRITYTCWRDSRVVCVMSTAFPGHAVNKVSRKKVSKKRGTIENFEILQPIIIEKYNAYMGGVDKSDQLLSYHNVLRKTLRYWKILFYHMIDIAAVNAFILYNLIATSSGVKTITENQFRDNLVLQIIAKYEKNERQEATSTVGRPSRSDCRKQNIFFKAKGTLPILPNS